VDEPGPECVEILDDPKLLDLLHRKVFNGRVWPDFFDLSIGDNRFVRATPLEPGLSVMREGLTFAPIRVTRSIETLGFLVDDGQRPVYPPRQSRHHATISGQQFLRSSHRLAAHSLLACSEGIGISPVRSVPKTGEIPDHPLNFPLPVTFPRCKLMTSCPT